MAEGGVLQRGLKSEQFQQSPDHFRSAFSQDPISRMCRGGTFSFIRYEIRWIISPNNMCKPVRAVSQLRQLLSKPIFLQSIPTSVVLQLNTALTTQV